METRRPQHAAWSDSLVPTAARLLVVAVLVEFLLLRVLNRVTGQFPAWAREQVSVDLVLLGTLAYNFAYILGALLLAAAGHRLLRDSDPLGYALVLWIPVLVAAHLLGSSWAGAVVAADLYAAALLAFFLVRALRAWARSVRATVPGKWPAWVFAFGPPGFIALVFAAYASSLYLRTGDALAALGPSLPGRADVYRIGEGFALAGAIVAPLAVRARPRARALLVPGLAVGLLAIASVARPDLLPLIGFWSLGFQIVLPMGLYLVGLGAFLLAVLGAKGSRQPYLFQGLLLVFLGGRLLADFYFVQLAVVALLFLSMGERLPVDARSTDPSEAPARAESAEVRAG
ncbi:MAG TPA: hypothetical protein VJ300_08340 [Thermoplasmata archaeon]|nr:hypothetical protein [Thermoplasmata archaeon]